MTGTPCGQHDGLERSVDRLLHGGSAEDGRRLVKQLVINIDQSFAHHEEYIFDVTDEIYRVVERTSAPLAGDRGR